jgi:hypothetical protein
MVDIKRKLTRTGFSCKGWRYCIAPVEKILFASFSTIKCNCWLVLSDQKKALNMWLGKIAPYFSYEVHVFF